MKLPTTSSATASLCEQSVFPIVQSNNDLLGNTTERSIGTYLSVRCLPGYVLSTESPQELLVCLSSRIHGGTAAWHKPIPRCEVLQTDSGMSTENTIIVVTSMFAAIILTLFIIILYGVNRWRTEKIDRYKWMEREQRLLGGGSASVLGGYQRRRGQPRGQQRPEDLYSEYMARGQSEFGSEMIGGGALLQGPDHLMLHSRPDLLASTLGRSYYGPGMGFYDSRVDVRENISRPVSRHGTHISIRGITHESPHHFKPNAESHFSIPRAYSIWEPDYSAHGLTKTTYPT